MRDMPWVRKGSASPGVGLKLIDPMVSDCGASAVPIVVETDLHLPFTTTSSDTFRKYSRHASMPATLATSPGVRAHQ